MGVTWRIWDVEVKAKRKENNNDDNIKIRMIKVKSDEHYSKAKKRECDGRLWELRNGFGKA